MGRGVSIAHVAAKAGVGVGTVSRVLNGNTRVSASTRDRVLHVMEALDYRPSRLASGLSRGRTGSVAVLVPFVTRPSVVARLAGVLSVLAAEGIDSLVCDIETAEQRDRRLDGLLRRHSADGVLVVSLPIPRRYVEGLRQMHIPLAAVDADIPTVRRVVTDDVTGGRLAAEHLTALGHTRIGFVGDEPDSRLGFVSTSRRLSGYRQALQAAGVTPDPRLVRRVPHGAEPAAAAAVALLKLPVSPTAIFAASDTQAMGVLRGAERVGLDVPGDLSVIGYDDVEAAEMLQLTTVHQPLKESGIRGAQIMCDLLGGTPTATSRQALPVEVVPRASTGYLKRARAPGPARTPAGRQPAPAGRHLPVPR